LGGFVAGEGSFYITRRATPYADGSIRPHFVFQVAVASRDDAILVALRQILGFGSIRSCRPRSALWQPQSVLHVASIKAHRAATIPFSERFLPDCAKRRQFAAWRDALEGHASSRPPRVRGTCRELGCGLPVRGRGLCRRHYYRVTGY
jgi:hypothetical protein